MFAWGQESRVASLALRRPQVPVFPDGKSANPIDQWVRAYFNEHGIDPPQPVQDSIFARRVYLDLWGLLPTPEQLGEFLRDPRPNKRDRLIDQLLAHKRNYSEHWISYWNDLLRNDEGVEYWSDTITRKSISEWLLKALEDNMPFDQFVSALLDPRRPGDPVGFLMGANWRGEVSASQTAPMQAAQNSAQVFLGVNLKCNSCHDSFISQWKLKDSYGLASFFSERELEIYRCDVKTGEKAQAAFLFPELGAIEAGASLAERRSRVAHLFTTRENGRFARTQVNRIWKKLMGRGLVDPVDNMEGEAWNPDVLDWLASDFVDHSYDLKFLLRRVMTSRTYQLPAASQAPGKEQVYIFRGPQFRRLTAEQFLDAISSITGEWRVLEPAHGGSGTLSRDWRLKLTALTRALGRPFRDQVFTERNEDVTTLQALELVNGETIAELLHQGAKRMLGERKPPPANLFDSGEIRSEKVDVDIDVSGARELRLLVEDAGSYEPNRVIAGWARGELVSAGGGVLALTDLSTKSLLAKKPLRIKGQVVHPESIVTGVPSEVVYHIAGKGYTRFRAIAGVDESCLQNVISPKVRFFVFSEEPDRRQLVRVVGDPPVPFQRQNFTTDSLISRIYLHALGRDPSDGERKVAQRFLTGAGSPTENSTRGVESFLWCVFLSPEFQFIR